MVAGASAATLFALTPLATALRNGGHDVIMATTSEMGPVAEGTGIPFVTVTDRSIVSLLWTDRAGNPVPVPRELADEVRFAGTWFGRLAAATLDGLLEVAGHWRPDLVIGGTNSYAASLLSAHLGVPHVRQAWDALDTAGEDEHADEELAPELAVLGLEKLPPPDLFLDICPPALRSPAAPEATMMRWVPGNLQRRLEHWMLTRTSRPRVCVTAGSRVAVTQSHEFLRALAENVSALDVEILVAAPEDVAPGLREQLPGLRIGWLPLDSVAPTCDLLVHHGGGVTAMTAMNAGVPQVVLPAWNIHGDSWARLGDYGASRTLQRGCQDAAAVAAACRDLITDPSYRVRAGALATEIASMPGPAAQVGVLEQLAAS